MQVPLPETIPDLDRLASEDPVLRHLLRIMRMGPTVTLADAASELTEMSVPSEKIASAVERVRGVVHDVYFAKEPRAIVAGGIEGWYPGPRDEDVSWPPFKRLLTDDGFDDTALMAVDKSSTKVVAYLPNPHALEPTQSRGLVLGYVQSGKTTNFTAVIAKAADAGYRFFVVLSGVHNALRQQTQDRLKEQLHALTDSRWLLLTDEEDFRPNAWAEAALTSNDKRVLAVVKKNPTRLRSLHRWLADARPETLAACPVLIIDDEADQASVNTAKPDRSPTIINGLIHQLLKVAPRSAYVGYTATPFANVLMDPAAKNSLYPKDFIVDLPKPEHYIGPEAIFGRETLELDSDDIEDGHDFVRTIDEDELDDLKPKGASTRFNFEAEITPSLEAALDYFLLSTAARRVRGPGNKHATALIHTSQFSVVHQRMADRIQRHTRVLAQKLASNDETLVERLRTTWDRECAAVPASSFDLKPVSWSDLRARLNAVASDVEVITDNSKSSERLSFDSARPRVIIAVGGNTLSRGLTLEGLAVSFFVRSASAYDTLLQMGRWFGYRVGYADLTRIWMTDTMLEWFHHLATVEQEIRYDIERYEKQHITPDQLGIRIRTHPKLAITAAAKMQGAVRAEASYSGRRVQTILFNHRDRDWLTRNLDAGRALLKAVADAPRVTKGSALVIGPVPTDRIIGFLKRYSFHENSVDLRSDLIVKYLEGRLADGELTHFRVAVMSKGAAPDDRLGTVELGLGKDVACVSRARLKKVGGSTYADIKSLMGPRDRAVDLDADWEEIKAHDRDLAQLRNTPDSARDGIGDGSGLLLLYPISKHSRPATVASAKTRLDLDAVEHVLGVGLVFPESSKDDALVDYDTANIRALADGDVEEPEHDDEVDENDLGVE